MDARIQVSFDDETTEIIEMISKKEKRPKSEVVRRMVEKWMERYEDKYWADIVAKEDASKKNPRCI